MSKNSKSQTNKSAPPLAQNTNTTAPINSNSQNATGQRKANWEKVAALVAVAMAFITIFALFPPLHQNYLFHESDQAIVQTNEGIRHIEGTKEQERLQIEGTKEQSEFLTIRVDGKLDIDPLEIHLSESSGIIYYYWKLSISNTGNRAFSVTGIDVKQSSGTVWLSGSPMPADGELWYSGLYKGLFTVESRNVESFALPFSLDGGSSKVVFLKLGLTMSDQAVKIAQEYQKSVKNHSTQDFMKQLWASGIDIYSNPVQAIQMNGTTIPNSYTFPASNSAKEQIFKITVKTSRGTIASEFTSWYAAIAQEMSK